MCCHVIIREQQADLTFGAGEEARSAALQVTTARLASTNSLLRDVAAIQRHAEQLCPGQHPLTDVMSDFSLDEPESSSHAEHAGLDSNHVESSPGASAVTDTSSTGKEVPRAMTAGFDFTPVFPPASGVALVEPAAYESLLATTYSPPQAAVPTSADASRPYKPMDYSKLLDSDSDEESEQAYMPADLGLGSVPYDGTDLEPEAGCACVRCQDKAEAAAAAAHAESNMPSQESEESPLPGIMSELQQAMTDSISSSGKPAHVMPALCFAA